jgi:GNAT superfamily N-acetyltransferase
MDDPGFKVLPISPDKLSLVLEVYRQCEDFLALGPEARASLEMVKRDIAGSQQQGGLYCGIFDLSGRLMGVLDYIPAGFQGDPAQAFLELLMIARPYRGNGLGGKVVEWLEDELCHNLHLKYLLLSVQVNNPDGLRFWQRCGFTIIHGPELQPDQTITYLMQKPVVTTDHKFNG